MWAPENSSCRISTKSIYLSHLTLPLKNTAYKVKPKNSAYTCKCLKTTNKKTTAKNCRTSQSDDRWRQSKVIEFYIFLPSPTVICRLWVSVPELWRASIPACLQGKIETAPFVSQLLTPYLCKPRFASKPKGRRWAIKQFSKWVITTPAQTLCGFKIVRTWRNVLIRETWVCVLGAPPPEHMGSGFMFQSLWNSHCGTDVLTEKGN